MRRLSVWMGATWVLALVSLVAISARQQIQVKWRLPRLQEGSTLPTGLQALPLETGSTARESFTAPAYPINAFRLGTEGVEGAPGTTVEIQLLGDRGRSLGDWVSIGDDTPPDQLAYTLPSVYSPSGHYTVVVSVTGGSRDPGAPSAVDLRYDESPGPAGSRLTVNGHRRPGALGVDLYMSVPVPAYLTQYPSLVLSGEDQGAPALTAVLSIVWVLALLSLLIGVPLLVWTVADLGRPLSSVVPTERIESPVELVAAKPVRSVSAGRKARKGAARRRH